MIVVLEGKIAHFCTIFIVLYRIYCYQSSFLHPIIDIFYVSKLNGYTFFVALATTVASTCNLPVFAFDGVIVDNAR